MSEEVPDLLGDLDATPAPEARPAPAPKRRGRPPKRMLKGTVPTPKRVRARPAPAPEPAAEPDEWGALDAQAFMRPVRASFLARVFGLTPYHANKKLAACPVAGEEVVKGNTYQLYDFKTACEHLLEPKGDLGDYLRNLSPQKMPVSINKAFWEGMLARQKFERAAGHLWHDEDVLDVLGHVAMLIKQTVQLWVEELPGASTMSTEQYATFQGLTTDLLNEVHKKLVVMPAERKTRCLTIAVDDEAPADG